MIRRLIILLLIVGCVTEPEPEPSICDGLTEVELWGVDYDIETTTEIVLHTQLTGSIPSEIGCLTNLTGLWLDRNQLGCYEYDFEGGCQSWNQSECCITHCDETEECDGEIPPEIGNLTNLDFLSLDNNQLTGEFSWIGNLTNLSVLSLSSNQLTGEIPVEIGNLTKLIYFGLHDNKLIGEIPPEIGNLTSLTTLRLDGNLLTGIIPESICELTNLNWDLTYKVNFGGNQFCPPYPECIPEGNLGNQDTSTCD